MRIQHGKMMPRVLDDCDCDGDGDDVDDVDDGGKASRTRVGVLGNKMDGTESINGR